MGIIYDYELHGWDAGGKPLSEDLTEDILNILDQIGTDECTISPVMKDSFITKYQSVNQGASGEVDDALKDFCAKHPDVLLQMEYLCQDNGFHSRTRYKNGETEEVEAVVTFPPFQKLLLPASGWILTDSDTGQHVRPLGNRCFECIDMGVKRSGTCYVSRRTIDLNDYDLDEDFFETYLKPYDYDSVQDVQEQYGEGADQIMVECIFETEMWEQDNIVYASTEDACLAYIQAVVSESR